jgi:hypothetical protein
MLTRAYWESQALQLPGGAYRVRPRGRWGAAYEVDQGTKDRIVRFQACTGWLALVAIVVAVPVFHRLDATPKGLFALVLVGLIFAVQEVGLCVILRGRPPQPRGQAPGAIRRPRSAPMPRWFFRLLLSLWALLLALNTFAMLPPILDGKCRRLN